MAEQEKHEDNEKRASRHIELPPLDDINKVMGYGLAAQNELADFSSSLLDQLRSVKTGDIEYPLEALLTQVQSVSLSGLSANEKNNKRLMRKAKKVLKGFNKADKQIFNLEMRLDVVKGDLMRDVVRLDKLKAKNRSHRQMLDGYISAGEKAMAEKAKASKGKGAEVLEEAGALNMLEKRVYDLKLAHTIASQVDPQITLIQNTNRALIERISTSLLSTIPLWRNQMALANILVKQKTVIDMEKRLSETAADKLKSGAVALKEAVEKGENPLLAVQRAGEELTATIKAVKSAYNAGETDIAAAMSAITELEKQTQQG